jgi:hypothetical protein
MEIKDGDWTTDNGQRTTDNGDEKVGHFKDALAVEVGDMALVGSEVHKPSEPSFA